MPDPTTEIVKALAEHIPVKDVYGDTLAPGAKQAGKFLEDVLKTVRLVLFPLQVAAASQDKFENFLRKAVSLVPEPQLIPPPTQILGPLLEGIKYEDEEGSLWRQYVNLLANSMDEKRANLAHPAFPALLRQMAPDEVRLLVLMREIDRRGLRLAVRVVTNDGGASKFTNPEIIQGASGAEVHQSDLALQLDFPENFDLYFWRLVAQILVHQGPGLDAEGLNNFYLSPLGQHFVTAISRSAGVSGSTL